MVKLQRSNKTVGALEGLGLADLAFYLNVIHVVGVLGRSGRCVMFYSRRVSEVERRPTPGDHSAHRLHPLPLTPIIDRAAK